MPVQLCNRWSRKQQGAQSRNNTTDTSVSAAVAELPTAESADSTAVLAAAAAAPDSAADGSSGAAAADSPASELPAADVEPQHTCTDAMVQTDDVAPENNNNNNNNSFVYSVAILWSVAAVALPAIFLKG